MGGITTRHHGLFGLKSLQTAGRKRQHASNGFQDMVDTAFQEADSRNPHSLANRLLATQLNTGNGLDIEDEDDESQYQARIEAERKKQKAQMKAAAQMKRVKPIKPSHTKIVHPAAVDVAQPKTHAHHYTHQSRKEVAELTTATADDLMKHLYSFTKEDKDGSLSRPVTPRKTMKKKARSKRRTPKVASHAVPNQKQKRKAPKPTKRVIQKRTWAEYLQSEKTEEKKEKNDSQREFASRNHEKQLLLNLKQAPRIKDELDVEEQAKEKKKIGLLHTLTLQAEGKKPPTESEGNVKHVQAEQEQEQDEDDWM